MMTPRKRAYFFTKSPGGPHHGSDSFNHHHNRGVDDDNNKLGPEVESDEDFEEMSQPNLQKKHLDNSNMIT